MTAPPDCLTDPPEMGGSAFRLAKSPPAILTPAPLPSGEGRLEIPFSPWEKGMG